ncbi:MAG: helix-turn-helix domain-containing protein [Muribaculaceae bacterium]|nr:helix-turn-helix domain-containing protein [Muribaculaceae bacterium]
MNVSRLKSAIETSALTKKQIAADSGISPQALHGILEQKVDPKVSTLEAIANVVGIKMGSLFEDSNIEIKDNDRSFNSNADEIIKELTSIIKSQEERIKQLTDKLLGI